MFHHILFFSYRYLNKAIIITSKCSERFETSGGSLRGCLPAVECNRRLERALQACRRRGLWRAWHGLRVSNSQPLAPWSSFLTLPLFLLILQECEKILSNEKKTPNLKHTPSLLSKFKSHCRLPKRHNSPFFFTLTKKGHLYWTKKWKGLHNQD